MRLFSFRKKTKPEKRIFKIDYLSCAHDDGKIIFFKKEFEEFKIVQAYDWLEALHKFNVDMKEFFACGNIYIKNIAEVKPIGEK